jgi:hypothetical protein
MNLSFLAGVTAPERMHATVYLDTSRDHENAAHEIEVRWRDAREELAGAGADEATLAALDGAVGTDEPRSGRTGLCLVVAEGGDVRFRRPMESPPPLEGARWSPLPHLLPWLVAQPRTVPHVVAVVDRVGADLYAFGPAERPDLVDEQTVQGGDRPIRKIRPGGWSNSRYQKRAENLWESNASQVAAEVDRLVTEVGAELVVAAGDVRARAALREHLGARAGQALVELDRGGRAPEADLDSLVGEVTEVVEERWARDRDALLDRYRSGDPGDPRDGLPAVVAALAATRVDTLLLRDPGPDATLHVGPEPTHLALTADTLTSLGVRDPRPEQAGAALVRAVAGTDASLLVLDDDSKLPDLADGVGFLPRY